MNEEKYLINCPRCGKVEGYIIVESEQEHEELEPEYAETLIEEAEFEQEGIPVRRVRCPSCGEWIEEDLVGPAE